MISRRTFLRSCAYGIPSVAALGWGTADLSPQGYTGTPTIERIKCPIADLPESFHGYTIGFITDLHLGMWVPEAWITSALDVLISEGTQLALLGGDFIWIDENPLWPALGVVRNWDYTDLPRKEVSEAIYTRVAALLGRYSFPDGMFAVAGNHDHWNDYLVFKSVMRSTPAVQLLMNESIRLEQQDGAIELFGVDDFLTGVPSLPVTPRRNNLPRIILSHNPDYASWLLRRDERSFDLALCGHTHGGQIRIPGLGAVAAQISDSRFVSGWVTVGTQAVYTSRGIGVVGLPYRAFCPPEITIITLSKPTM